MRPFAVITVATYLMDVSCIVLVTIVVVVVVVDRCGTTVGLHRQTFNSGSITSWQVAAVNTAVIDVCGCLLTRFIQLLTITVTLIMGRR